MVRIGITSDCLRSQDHKRNTISHHFALAKSYVQATIQAGGVPYVLPYSLQIEPSTLLDVLDGLIISGGDFDIPPSFYGTTENSNLSKTHPDRSRFELSLLKYCFAQNKPVLGICGGMQLINVACGGTLYQDLRERPDTECHVQPTLTDQPHHSVAMTPLSRLAQLCGPEKLEVNSTHHQIIRKLGNNLLASAYAPDGVIEGVERTDQRFVMGVQWHPEKLASPRQQAIYKGFVTACASSRKSNCQIEHTH